MLCYIKYTDYSIHSKQQATKDTDFTVPQPDASNKILLVHIFCPIQIIMDYICTEIGFFGGIEMIDLAHVNGDRLKLSKYPPSTQGSKVLKTKETYYAIVAMMKQNKKVFVPILDKGSIEYINFMNGVVTKDPLNQPNPANPPKSEVKHIRRSEIRSQTHSEGNADVSALSIKRPKTLKRNSDIGF